MKQKLTIITFTLLAVLAVWWLSSGPGSAFPSRLLLVATVLVYGLLLTGLHRTADRKKMHQEVRENHERLEKEVTHRTEELNIVNDILRKEILDRTRTEEELYRSESFLNTIFDSFHDPFCIVDREYRIIKFNDAYIRMRNKPPKELYEKTCYKVLRNKTTVCEDCVIEKTFHSKDPCAKEKPVVLADGSEMWMEIYTYPIFDHEKNVTHAIEYMRDITERKRTEEEKKRLIEKLNYLSTTDVLTGLLNRRALTDVLEHEITRAQRYAADLSLILCDLDYFKLINDTYGHAVGDSALIAVSDAIKRSIRKADILGRYGGDEFMIILPETSLEGAKLLAEKDPGGCCRNRTDCRGRRDDTARTQSRRGRLLHIRGHHRYPGQTCRRRAVRIEAGRQEPRYLRYGNEDRTWLCIVIPFSRLFICFQSSCLDAGFRIQRFKIHYCSCHHEFARFLCVLAAIELSLSTYTSPSRERLG